MSLNSLGTSNGMTSSRMTHSLSTPSGVDGGSSATSRTGGKKLAIRVQMLDDSMTLFQVQACDIIFAQIRLNIDTVLLSLILIFRQKHSVKFFSSRSVDNLIYWKQIILDWSILRLRRVLNIGLISKRHSIVRLASLSSIHSYDFV